MEVETDALVSIQLLSANNIENHPLNIIIFDCKSLMPVARVINMIIYRRQICVPMLLLMMPQFLWGICISIFAFLPVFLICFMQTIWGPHVPDMYSFNFL